jgi:hypothetical protein
MISIDLYSPVVFLMSVDSEWSCIEQECKPTKVEHKQTKTIEITNVENFNMLKISSNYKAQDHVNCIK